jgi:8-oxo-dGTP pyrophosphatase MutT (NUDIX family)
LVQHRGEDIPFVWATLGGALEVGETPEQAAIRELREEIGLQVESVGPCVWTRTHLFRWQGEIYDVRERFFVCCIDGYDVGDHLNEDELEREWVLGHRWWSVSEISTSAEVFVPRNLSELLLPLLRGEYPDEPFEVGI